jgi:hypothetical protein
MSKQEREPRKPDRPQAARDGRKPLNHALRDPARDLPRDNRSRVRRGPAPAAQAGSGGPQAEETERQGRLF